MTPISSDLVYTLVAASHAGIGSVALMTFWIAAVARKRRAGLHVRAGTIYLRSMRLVLLTGMPLAGFAFFRGQLLKGAFLSYLLILVSTTVYLAPRAVRLKNDFEQFRRGLFPLLAWTLPVASLAALIAGIALIAPILLGLSTLGLFVGINLQRTLRVARPDSGWWLRQHYTAMIGSGIGTHVAFLSIGLGRLLPIHAAGPAQYLPWFGPIAVGLLARGWLNHRHARKFVPA